MTHRTTKAAILVAAGLFAATPALAQKGGKGSGGGGSDGGSGACAPVLDPAASPYLGGQGAFAPVIDASLNMQHPKTSTCLSLQQMRDGYVLDGQSVFKLVDGGLHFEFRNAKQSTRMELRGGEFAAQSQDKAWSATVTLLNQEGSDGYTVGQVFGVAEGAYSKPIVRIAYKESLTGVDGVTRSDYLWAVYREGTGSTSSVKNYPLGPAPSGSSAGIVSSVYRPGGADEVHVSYAMPPVDYGTHVIPIGAVWLGAGANVYHKAGCYLQNAGDCQVRFDALDFDD